MILQALADLYEVLARQGKVPVDGWAWSAVGEEICLRPDGTVEQIICIKTIQEKGKPRPQMMLLPNWCNDIGSGVRANFLYNQAGYVLGITTRGTKESRLMEMRRKCWELHHQVLDGLDCPAAKAVLAYLDRMIVGVALPDDVLSGLTDDALSGDNFIFSVNGVRLQDIPEVRDAWDRVYQGLGGDKVAQCLVTGKQSPPAEKHPFIKGLRGAQGKGAALSSYNPVSFWSYGYEQNLNAPVSRHAAYAYTQALTFLLGNNLYHKAFGNGLTVVWWAEDAQQQSSQFFCGAIFGDKSESWTDNDISQILDTLSKGRPVGELDPGRRFFILGLSPNSSRIIVRFFLRDTFGGIMRNVMEHYGRLELDGSAGDGSRLLTSAKAFRAMVRENVDKELPEVVIDRYFQSVMFGHRYPTQMFALTQHRLTLDTAMYWQRTSLVKAYFLQTLPEDDVRRKCFSMHLDVENTDPGYVLGRLFALYEAAQNLGLGAKPWDKAPIHSMFGSAMSTPGVVFPRLTRLAEVHLTKPECGWYAKSVQEVKALLPDRYPIRLDLVEQGAFDLGYYHQRHAMFSKKAEAAEDNLESEE